MRKMLKFGSCAMLAIGLVFGALAATAETVDPALKAAPAPDATYDNITVAADDFVLGNADAPVTIVEYASLTCPHCARFHAEVLPKLKKTYIDTGKARLVYRDFPLDRFALAGSMLARCAGRDRYFAFVDLLFRDQTRWARSKNPMQSLGQIARLGGLTGEKFSTCLKDGKIQNAVLQQRLQGSKAYQINSTPTLLVNGRKYSGGLTFDQLRAVLDSMLPKS